MIEAFSSGQLKQIAASYISEVIKAEMDDGYERTDEGLLFGYHRGDPDENGVLPPGNGGTLLVRWDGSALDIASPIYDAIELPALPALSIAGEGVVIT